MNDATTREVPQTACLFAGGVITAGTNGDGAKTTPVKLLARSAQPVPHWYWGRAVHDMAGMAMHKSRLAIDYAHDSADIIGYVSHAETTPAGLELSGALVPYKDNDRANEVAFKMAAGVPYEASINFGGGDIEIEDVAKGHSVAVNGYQFTGPGTVFRK